MHLDRVRQLEDSVEATSDMERRADKVSYSAKLFLKHSTWEKENYITDPLHRTRVRQVNTLPQSKTQQEKARKELKLKEAKTLAEKGRLLSFEELGESMSNIVILE